MLPRSSGSATAFRRASNLQCVTANRHANRWITKDKNFPVASRSKQMYTESEQPHHFFYEGILERLSEEQFFAYSFGPSTRQSLLYTLLLMSRQGVSPTVN
ncbi:hypothetical protein Y032_0021g349 [Ancylostoma ceylanicum]|uniref:Uncharacterized protein n=1 Tax=Ancylostoma ceylanicum TaxID=53326 RepID=A0A016UZ28_9BILA|nr:hypothetical protein Y032_0021g349 [Ancylostoma ceylanicum]